MSKDCVDPSTERSTQDRSFLRAEPGQGIARPVMAQSVASTDSDGENAAPSLLSRAEALPQYRRSLFRR